MQELSEDYTYVSLARGLCNLSGSRRPNNYHYLPLG